MKNFSPYLLLQLVRRDRTLPQKLEYHYMGAAEFEWGVIPLLWKTLSQHRTKLVVGEYHESGVEITKTWGRDTPVATVDVHLHYAAMPVVIDYNNGAKEKPLDITAVLKAAVHNEAKGHEPFYLEEMFVKKTQEGWLSVPINPNANTELPPGYLFVAATEKETFDIMMQRIENPI